jgi:hypothetical protein
MAMRIAINYPGELPRGKSALLKHNKWPDPAACPNYRSV